MQKGNLSRLISELSIEKAMNEGETVINSGISLLDYQSEIINGLRIIENKYSQGQCFIADLMVAGMLAKDLFALTKDKHLLKENLYGKIVIGTIYEDIHDIGKDLLADALCYRGIELINLGVDVPVQRFIDATIEYQPDILAISTSMDSTLAHVKTLIARLPESDIPVDLKIIVGGTAVDERFSQVDGVDCLARDYQKSINYCVQVLKKKYHGEAVDFV